MIRSLAPVNPDPYTFFYSHSSAARAWGSFARNFGAAEATAPYLCFLDDDDTWTDPNHLSRAHAVITEADSPVDIYMTNQAAFLHDKQLPGPFWIEDLPPILAKLGNRPDRHGTYTVTVEELLRSQGFCHLNTLIVRRACTRVGGLDERRRVGGGPGSVSQADRPRGCHKVRADHRRAAQRPGSRPRQPT